MSKKRKTLLIITIAIILASYGITYFIIINDYGSLSNIKHVYSNKYIGNQLPDGSSPLDCCFGKGMFSGKATLTVKNGAKSDAIVCLYSISLDRTIRNTYVRRNSTFTIYNISRGSYKIRVLFGNNWNPKHKNPCGINGYFDSDVHFSEFDKDEYFDDNIDGYTVATITLYSVTGGNASTSQINKSDFFRK